MKNPTVKKIFACVAVLTVLTGSAQGAYKVEIDDDTYVSDEVYFAPVSTWDEVKAQRINLKQGKVLFYAGKENEPYKIAAEVMPLNTTNKKIIYKSEDITIATVDENGVVTPTDKIGDTFIDIRCGNALSKLKVSVDGEHIHLGEACGPEGSGCFVKVKGQAGRVVGIGRDDDSAAHLLPLAQQPGTGVEILAVAAVDAAGVHFQAAVMLFGHSQCLEGSGLVAGRLLVEELALAVQLLDEVDVSQDVRAFGRHLCHLGKVGLDCGQRVAVEVIEDAVVQVLRAEVDLVIPAGVLAVDDARRRSSNRRFRAYPHSARPTRCRRGCPPCPGTPP